MWKLAFVLFCLPVVASARSFEIGPRFVSERAFSACNMLGVVKRLEREAPRDAEAKERYEAAKELLGATLNAELRRQAATVTISVALPGTLQLNPAKFFVTGLDGAQIGTFSSDLLGELDSQHRAVLTGNGRASFSINLTVAAFCEGYLAKGGTPPTLEEVIDGLIQ